MDLEKYFGTNIEYFLFRHLWQLNKVNIIEWLKIDQRITEFIKLNSANAANTYLNVRMDSFDKFWDICWTLSVLAVGSLNSPWQESGLIVDTQPKLPIPLNHSTLSIYWRPTRLFIQF